MTLCQDCRNNTDAYSSTAIEKGNVARCDRCKQTPKNKEEEKEEEEPHPPRNGVRDPWTEKPRHDHADADFLLFLLAAFGFLSGVFLFGGFLYAIILGV